MRLLILLIFLLSGAASANENGLVGVWRSDEELTLKSMNEVSSIPTEIRARFEQDFFGRLFIEYTQEMYSIWFVDKDRPKEYAHYKILDESASYIKIEDTDPISGGARITELLKHDNCYSIPVPKWGFREYFCRVQQGL